MSTDVFNPEERPWQQYICLACGLIYDEKLGDPDSGLAPGTALKIYPMTGNARCAA